MKNINLRNEDIYKGVLQAHAKMYNRALAWAEKALGDDIKTVAGFLRALYKSLLDFEVTASYSQEDVKTYYAARYLAATQHEDVYEVYHDLEVFREDISAGCYDDLPEDEKDHEIMWFGLCEQAAKESGYTNIYRDLLEIESLEITEFEETHYDRAILYRMMIKLLTSFEKFASFEKSEVIIDDFAEQYTIKTTFKGIQLLKSQKELWRSNRDARMLYGNEIVSMAEQILSTIFKDDGTLDIDEEW